MARKSFSFIAESADLPTHIKKPWYEIENRLPIIVDKFNDGVANGWVVSGGAWSAGSGYVQSQTDGSIFLYAGPQDYDYYTYEAEVKLHYGSWAGLIFNRLNNTSYYQFMLQMAGSVFLQTAAGSTISSADLTVNSGSWYRLKAEVSGTSIKCYVNDALKISTTGSLYPSGNVGFKIIGGSGFLDNVEFYKVQELITPERHCLENLKISQTMNDKVDKINLGLCNNNNERLPIYDLNNEIIARIGYSGALGSMFGGNINSIDPNFGIEGNVFDIEAQGYSQLLLNKTDVIVYEDKSGGEIIKDMLNRNFPNIDTGSIIYSGYGLPRYDVVYMPVFDTVKDIANNYDDGVFRIDEKRMAYYTSGNDIGTNSTIMYAGSNIIKADFSINADKLYNAVYLIGGDKDMNAGSWIGASGGSFMITDTIISSGTFKQYGSNINRFDVWTKPVNSGIGIQVEIRKPSGTTYDPENMTYGLVESDHISSNGYTAVELDKFNLTSGNTYWYLVSSTGVGSVWLMTSGGSILNYHYYGKPIIEYSEDPISIREYTGGTPKEKVLIDRRIKHTDTAQRKVKQYLQEHSKPKYDGRITTIGDISIRAGSYTRVVIPQQDINEQFLTKEVTHSITNGGFTTDLVVDADIDDLAWKMKDHEDRLKALETANIDTDINLVKFFSFLDSFRFSGTSLARYHITDLGSSFILDHPTLGRLGSPLSGIAPYLGDSRASWSAI